ncbi:pentapeptide repeat-containing protein [Spirosoma sordidisoli]|uniref:Pentapeptide repeat-containing protein n=1 Tax=Spirosoma sordidisoli TaxID=2502893 RepID=A0A4Q2UQU1_9BACT|nr:pentapeptide repeat-containing protein [Spirosoma sordidisoli]RYC70020.1 hypothetical protein EQG79_09115 [Spirosoma sordidisoli]
MKRLSWLLLYCLIHLTALGQSRNWSLLPSGQLIPEDLRSRVYFGRSLPLAPVNRSRAFNKQAIDRHRILFAEYLTKQSENFIAPGYRISISNKDKKLFTFSLTDTTSFCTYTGDGNVIGDTCFIQWSRFQANEFGHTTFRRYVGFDYSYFESANFNYSTFAEPASFQGVTFGEDTNFDGVAFLGKADFSGALFERISHLSDIYFNDEAKFSSTIFPQFTTFNSSTFAINPVFTNAQLPNELSFNDVQFTYKSPLEINAKVDFTHTQIDSLRKRTGDPSAKCIISLRNTDVSRFILPYDYFKIAFDELLPLNDSVLVALLDSNKPKPVYTYEEKSSLYEALIKNCQEAGMTKSVQGWDIEYRKMQNEYKFGWLSLFINYFNEWWWNFGYDRWRILVIWLPFFFLSFLTYNYWHIERLRSKMYQDSELGIHFKDQAGNSPRPVFKNWRKRFSFVFFYTAVIYFGFKIRHESVNYNYTRGLLYLYLMYAIGTIHMAFAFSYILSAY